MTFKKINNQETVLHWISGAYKIVKFDYRRTGTGQLEKKTTYSAFNKFYDHKLKIYVSGNYINNYFPHYDTLKDAKIACNYHAQINPSIANNTDMFYIDYKYKIGDILNYTNSNGVNWGKRTIIGTDQRTGEPCYYITPTDTPWFAVREEELTPLHINIHAAFGDLQETAEKEGWI
jgi:hypothetical protein